VAQAGLVLSAPLFIVEEVPTLALLLIIGAVALSNLLLSFLVPASWGRGLGRQTPKHRSSFWSSHGVFLVLLTDVLALWALLYLTGGASNPFGFFFVLHVALAAILIGERATWAIAGLSVLAYGSLFFFYQPLPELSQGGMEHHHHAHDSFSLHLYGMWGAFAIVAGVLSLFFTRMLREAQLSEKARKEAELRALRAEQVAAVTALGATAAHQLNTPLCTIAVVAEELASLSSEQVSAQQLHKDAGLISRQVEVCKAVLGRLRRASGDREGEMPQELPLEVLAEQVRASFPKEEGDRIRLKHPKESISLWAPREALTDALLVLVQNALEASPGSPIILDAVRTPSRQCVSVEDHGPGIPAEILGKLGEPFVTTKTQGIGLGLGVFLAKCTVERLGGWLRFHSVPGSGTRVDVELPGAIAA
jgi:two-component system sensor histidine kinase RegB